MAERLTFLVLDDDGDSRFLRRRALQKVFTGCEVVEADTCAAALRCADIESFDAVLTDHHLAEANALAFVDGLRQRGTRGPIVMITLHDNPGVHQRAYAAGASHVFHPGDTDLMGYLSATLAA
jgi:CheY-like chemotaxis protein